MIRQEAKEVLRPSVDRLKTAEVAEEYPGMSPTQALVHVFKDQIVGHPSFASRMVQWLEEKERRVVGKPEDWWNKTLDAVASLVPTEEELAERWFLSVVRRTLVDEGYDTVFGRYHKKNGKPTAEYYKLVAETERNWRRFSQSGLRDVVVNVDYGSVRTLSKFDNTDLTPAEQRVWNTVSRAYNALLHSKLAKGMVLTAVLAAQADALVACDAKQPVATQVIKTPVGTPYVPPESTDDWRTGTETQSPYVSPTMRAKETLVPTPTPLPETVIRAEGGEYTEAQKALIESEAYRDKLDKLYRWFNYWSMPNATNRAFNYQSLVVHEKAIWDNFDNPSEAAPMLEALMDDAKWHTYTVPKGDWKREPPVPPKGSYAIGVGDGPLELTAGDPKLGLILGFKDGEFVRMNAAGEVVEFVNKDGVWERVEKGEFDYSQIDFRPQTEADMAMVLEAPNPVGEPGRFGRFLEGLEEKLDPKAEAGFRSFAVVETGRMGSGTWLVDVNMQGGPITSFKYVDDKGNAFLTAVFYDGTKDSGGDGGPVYYYLTLVDMQLDGEKFVSEQLSILNGGGEVKMLLYTSDDTITAMAATVPPQYADYGDQQYGLALELVDALPIDDGRVITGGKVRVYPGFVKVK